MSSTPKRHLAWRAAFDDHSQAWRVIDESHAVVCKGLCDKDDAEAIAEQHNDVMRTRAREDWWECRNR
jgi:hypothetical protein